MNILKKLRTDAGLLQKDIAAAIGVDRTTYLRYEKGETEPDISTLRKLAAFYDVPVDRIVLDDSETDVYAAENLMPIRTKKVPLLGDIACGQQIFAEEHYGEYVDVDAGVRCDFCLRARGDSMTGARIHDGDIVFCRKQPTVENGEIAAVIIDNEATLKRWYLYPNKLVLVAENPAYEPLVFTGAELAEVSVLGKAVAFQSLVI